MASAKKTTQRVSRVVYDEVDKYVLELTTEEARTLYRVCSNILGSTGNWKGTWSRRAHTARMRSALDEVGVHPKRSEFPIEGGIRFPDCDQEGND